MEMRIKSRKRPKVKVLRKTNQNLGSRRIRPRVTRKRKARRMIRMRSKRQRVKRNRKRRMRFSITPNLTLRQLRK